MSKKQKKQKKRKKYNKKNNKKTTISFNMIYIWNRILLCKTPPREWYFYMKFLSLFCLFRCYCLRTSSEFWIDVGLEHMQPSISLLPLSQSPNINGLLLEDHNNEGCGLWWWLKCFFFFALKALWAYFCIYFLLQSLTKF